MYTVIYIADGTEKQSFPNMKIYLDDTIGAVKLKILTELFNAGINVAMEELYLFFKEEDSPYATKVELKKLLDPPLNNNSILMDCIQENKIYFSLAEDLISKNELMTNNYFPYLYEKNITQLNELTDQRQKLMETKK